jgi:hypothetical protein
VVVLNGASLALKFLLQFLQQAAVLYVGLLAPAHAGNVL